MSQKPVTQVSRYNVYNNECDSQITLKTFLQ